MTSTPPRSFVPTLRAVQAVGRDWAAAARALADQLGTADAAAGETHLGFLYATDRLADDLGSVLTFLNQTTGIDHWVGGTGIGIFAGDRAGDDREYFDAPALVALIATFPAGAGDAFQVFALDPDGRPAPAPPTDAMTAFVHADPMNEDTLDALDDLARQGPGFLLGGLTSAREHTVQVADGVSDAVLSGVAFAPEVELATGLTQGCTALGDMHTINEVDGNILQGLDGQNALDVLKADLGGIDNDDLNGIAGQVHVGIPVAGSDTGDFTVRALAGIDPSRGWLLIGEALDAGDGLFFVRRDGRSAEIDMIHMLENLKSRTLDRGRTIRGALYVSCIARGPAMFDEPGREMALIRDVLGDFPLTGFYASGEISASRLYGYTGVLTLFLE